jgi:hypothetical protein
MFALGLIVGAIAGTAVTFLVYLAEKESLDGWSNSCTGECNQGRNCNCVEKK